MIYFRNRYYVHALHLSGWRLGLWFLQVTIIDLIPKIITGKFWLAKSYLEFLKHLKDVRAKRQEFAHLMGQHKSTTTVPDIIAKIARSIKGKHTTQVNI